MLKNKIASLVIVDVLIAAVSFLALPIFLRMMLKDEIGEFSYLQAFYSSWMLVASLSAYTLLLKNISSSNDPIQKAQNISSAMLLSVGGIIGSASLFLLVVFFFMPASAGAEIVARLEFLYLLFFIVVISVMNLNLLSILIAEENLIRLNKFKVLRGLGSIGLGLLIVSESYFSESAVYNRLAAILFVECIAFIIFFKPFMRSFIINRAVISSLLPHLIIITPLIFGSLIALAQNMTDKSLLIAYVGSEAMAEYGLALVIVSPIPMIMTAVMNSWVVTFYAIESPNKARSALISMAVKLALIFTIMVGGLTLLSWLLLAFEVIPQVYWALVYDVPALGIGTLLISLNQLNYAAFMYAEKTSSQLISTCFSAVILGTVSVVLIPITGKFGAIVAFISAAAGGFLLASTFANRALNDKAFAKVQ
jgi:O-antigen/teichoic acid export membrane protein